MLEFKNVTKQFETITAVKHVSFTVNKGEVLGIVGRNGSGKSTMFRMVLGLIQPNEGEIMFQHQPISPSILDIFGYLPEEGSLLSQYTVLDICEYYAALKGVTMEDTLSRLQYWLKQFHMEDLLFLKAKKLSKGNRQKIQFIISILHDPQLIILDEPFSGLDPISVEELEQAILQLKKQGKTILFSSHIMNHVENLCDKVLLIDHGNVLLQGSIDDVLHSYQINGKAASSLNEIFINKVGES